VLATYDIQEAQEIRVATMKALCWWGQPLYTHVTLEDDEIRGSFQGPQAFCRGLWQGFGVANSVELGIGWGEYSARTLLDPMLRTLTAAVPWP
jgi:hypothetical protein